MRKYTESEITRLCEALRESEWMARFIRMRDAALPHLVRSSNGEETLRSWLQRPMAPSRFDPWAQPLAAELYTLAETILSGQKTTSSSSSVWSWQALVEALRETPEWHIALSRLVALERKIGGAREEAELALYLLNDLREKCQRQGPYGDALSSLHVLVDQIRSGAVFGSPTRCAICDGGKPVAGGWVSPDGLVRRGSRIRLYRCTEHLSCDLAPSPKDYLELDGYGILVRIFRSRRWLAERVAKQASVASPAASEPETAPIVDPYVAQRQRESEPGFLAVVDGDKTNVAASQARRVRERYEERKAEQEVCSKYRRELQLLGKRRGADPRIVCAFGDFGFDPRRR